MRVTSRRIRSILAKSIQIEFLASTLITNNALDGKIGHFSI